MVKLKEKHIIIALMTLQVGLCAPFLVYNAIALDEPFTIFHSQKQLGDLLQIFETENNPPLHFILLHFWIKLFGISAAAVRSLSLIFSLLTIPVLYKLARKVTSVPLAIVVTVLFICSSFHHYHAVEARTYSLFVLLFCLILYDLYSFLFEAKKFTFLRLAVWNVALLYTHYLGGFILVVEGIMLLVFYKQLTRQKLKHIGIAAGIILLAYIPGVRLLLTRVDSFASSGTWVPPAQYSELYGNIVRFLNGKYAVLAVVVVVIMVAAVNFNVWRKKQEWRMLKTTNHLFFIFAFLIPYLGMFIVSKLVEPIFLDRYLLFTTVPLFIIIAVIIGLFLTAKSKWFLYLILFPYILAMQLLPENNRQPLMAAEWVQNKKALNPQTEIYICPAFYELTFLYHYNRQAFSDYNQLPEFKNNHNIYTIFSANEMNIQPQTQAIIYIDSDAKFSYPNNGIVEEIEQKFTFIEEMLLNGGLTIYYYKRQGG